MIFYPLKPIARFTIASVLKSKTTSNEKWKMKGKNSNGINTIKIQ